MAPIASMKPAGSDSPSPIYAWSERPLPFTVAVLSGDDELATTEVERGADRGVLAAETTVAEEGFVGRLWMPPDGVDVRTPAIVALGGSEGGLGTFLWGWALAGEGYPVLEVAYFDGDGPDLAGLPDDLADIPLEYFAGAVRWLGPQPDVDPRDIWTMGASRGSEAALLVGAEFPGLVAGAIGLSPANVAVCRPPRCEGPV